MTDLRQRQELIVNVGIFAAALRKVTGREWEVENTYGVNDLRDRPVRKAVLKGLSQDEANELLERFAALGMWRQEDLLMLDPAGYKLEIQYNSGSPITPIWIRESLFIVTPGKDGYVMAFRHDLLREQTLEGTQLAGALAEAARGSGRLL